MPNTKNSTPLVNPSPVSPTSVPAAAGGHGMPNINFPGIIYAPYIPLYQTATQYQIEYRVSCNTGNIPNFRQRFPRGLTLKPEIYYQILTRLNTDLATYKNCIGFKELVREKLNLGMIICKDKWEAYPFYHHLWNAQGYGPFNFDATDSLFFNGVFTAMPFNSKFDSAWNCFKKHYTVGKKNIQVRLHGKLYVNGRHEITDLKPQELSWWEDNEQIT